MVKLSDIKKSTKVKIASLPPEKMLKNLGLREGKEISNFSKELFGGPLIIEIDGRMIAVSEEIAGNILVEES